MRFLFICSLFILNVIHAQNEIQLLYEELPNDSVQKWDLQNHSDFKPFVRWNNFEKGHLGFGKNRDNKKLFKLNLITDNTLRFDENIAYRIGEGIKVESNFKNKWYFTTIGVFGFAKSDSLLYNKAPFKLEDSEEYKYIDFRSRVSYTPNEIFNFQVGLDNHFIGEGSRSLFLSDYGVPFPFGQIRSKFWRIEYSILYQLFREDNLTKWIAKNGTSHHLSFNAAKWLNLSVFETVIFKPKDTLLNRGFDVEYLNPVIFFRPQEYSLGSSDNVLLGASITAKLKNHTIYSQLILDEFVLEEIKTHSGWWANKFGGQLGVKGRFNLGTFKCFYRNELNFVRPYTYAHLSQDQNYGNQGFSLGHPMGANFVEFLAEFKVQKNRWLGKFFALYSLQGFDKDGFNYGSNIYQPYTQRPYEFGHTIGQGQGKNSMIISLNATFNLIKNGNIQCFLEPQMRFNSINKQFNFPIYFGIRSRIWNDYRNY